MICSGHKFAWLLTAMLITACGRGDSAASRKSLVIFEARYGAQNTWIDVSGVLEARIHGDSLSAVRVDNTLVGYDPLPGVPKSLTVIFKTNDGLTNTVRVKENAYFAIPYLDPYDVAQPPEVQQQLAQPLATSNQTKIWPAGGIRGLNSQPVATHSGNTNNPGQYFTDATFSKFKSWGVNVVRVMIRVDEGSAWDVPAGEPLPPIPADNPMAPYRHHLEGLRVALKLAEKYHIYIIPSGDSVVGRDGESLAYYQSLSQLWQYIAGNFGRHPYLLAYDLLNEPHGSGETNYYFETALPELVRAIRALDTNSYIVVEPAPFALPDQGFAALSPIADPKVVYSFHWYYPHPYTHQGLGDYPRLSEAYPGTFAVFPGSPAQSWDRERMSNYMAEVRRFQLEHNAIIWVGEFSAIRWAQGAAAWLADSIAVFESYNWSWAYHAYRGWNGWNPTFSATDPVSNEDDGGQTTDRLEALLEGWSRNEEPR